MNFKYFNLSDFNCQETGENEMDLDFIRDLDELREACGFPFIVTSGYRSPSHSIEAKKEKPGMHAHGIAADIQVRDCLLYTSPSPRDRTRSRMPSSA